MGPLWANETPKLTAERDSAKQAANGTLSCETRVVFLPLVDPSLHSQGNLSWESLKHER